METDNGAGKIAPKDKLVNLATLMADYYTKKAEIKVTFGTSGHRGKAFLGSFNEEHVLAIVQAICDYRQTVKRGGPLYLGYDTHALSEAAFRSALEVLAGNNVSTVIHNNNEYTPTPVISFLILEHNRHNPTKLADGIIITPSHNPPTDGGIKYNPPHGGPAEDEITTLIENRANEIIKNKFIDVKRFSYQKAKNKNSVQSENFIEPFVKSLKNVVNMEIIQKSGLKLAADPMGGSGVHFWQPIIEHYKIDLTITNPWVDPSFSFMPLDHDGLIRMDCSSPMAMANLLKSAPDFDLAFANDPDFDRHGIVSEGILMNPNHYLAVAIDYLISHRPAWNPEMKIGKTLVSSSLIDKVVLEKKRKLYETPVGFKWFVDGLYNSSLAFAGEESAGATFLQKNGLPWTTDKDGFSMALLAAEIMAVTGDSPGKRYQKISQKYGDLYYQRLDLLLNPKDKEKLNKIKAKSFINSKLAGLKINQALSKAPGNQADIGGIKIILEDNSWLAIRPSGTEPKMKIYAESFSGFKTWQKIITEGQNLILG